MERSTTDRMWPSQDLHSSGAQACQPSPVLLQAYFPAFEHARTAKDISEFPRAHSQAVTRHCLFSQGLRVLRDGGSSGDSPGTFLIAG